MTHEPKREPPEDIIRDRGSYILDGHAVVKCDSLLKWGRWLEEHRAEMIVKIEDLPGDYEVHTCFMGLDMNIGAIFGESNAPPLLFETTVFSGFERSGEIMALERCSTWEEAERMHERIAARFRSAVNS
jgi:hypothetical protein